MKKKSKQTIALLYHYVPKATNKDEYFSKKHSLVDNQTDEIVKFMDKLFRARGYKVQIVKVAPNNLSELKNLAADYVFNLVDSKAMEMEIAHVLSRLNIPYSGSASHALQTSNDKVRTKHLFQKARIPTPDFHVLRLKERLNRSSLPAPFPLIVKPAYEHCSIGITNKSIVRSYEQYKHQVAKMRKEFKSALLVEAFIPGTELQVTVYEKMGQTLVLPIAQIAFKKHLAKNIWNIYGFDEKWSKEKVSYQACYFVAPPKAIASPIITQIQRDAVRAFHIIGLKDYARFDLRYNAKLKQWYFLEANANPGFDPNPRDAMTISIIKAGMTIEDFIVQIVRNGLA